MVTSRNPRDINIPYPWVDGLERRTQEQLYMDFMALGRAGSGKYWRTIVIAASNSSDAAKASADYVCTGTADQLIINTAITTLEAKSGTQQLGRIVFLEGLFTLSAQITINTLTARSIWMEGMGGGMGIDNLGNTIEGTHFVLSSSSDSAFFFGGNSAVAGSSVIMENMRVSASTSAPTVSSRDMGLIVRNCTVINAGAGGGIVQTNSTGQSGLSRIEECIVETSGGIGVLLAGASSSGGVYGSISRCFVYAAGANAIGIKCDNNIGNVPAYHISDNHVRMNSSSGTTGIQISGNSAQHNMVSNNVVIGPVDVGIRVGGFSAEITGNLITGATNGIMDSAFECDYALISGNNINACSTLGIQVGGNGTSVRCAIIGNSIVNGPTTGPTIGIKVGSGATDTAVFGNDVYAAGTAVSDAGTRTRTDSSLLTTGAIGASAKFIIDHGGSAVGTRSALNFIDGSNVTWTTADNSGSDRVDVTPVLTRQMYAHKDSSGTVYNRGRINFITGTGIALTVAEDAGNDNIDVTIAATGAGATVEVAKNNSAAIGTEGQINFIEGSGITLTIADDGAHSRVNVTIAAAGGPSAWDPILTYKNYR